MQRYSSPNNNYYYINMDCFESIYIYNKVGGILTYDYNKNIVTVTNTNL